MNLLIDHPGMNTDTLAYPYAKVCDECYEDFESWDSDDELCPRCHREYLRENCPEALAEWDDQWAEGVVLPQATGTGGGEHEGATA